mmetsp:Transcript_3294/g.14345  ORF Transcript_3294/g.14345 Transcript_3294/m.14345 type:complete len:599 (-) Transcript_3294:14-1810(-)
MSRSSLIPTQESGYGSTPAVVSAKKESSPFTRNRVIALACSALGLIAVVGFGSRMNSDAALGNPFQQIMHAQAKQYEALQASKAAGIKMLSSMPVRPVFAPNARAQLGASEYQRCVAHESKPSEGYNVSDSDQIRRDLVFDVSREDYPAVTAYNDSKTLLADVSCKVTPPGKFLDTELCMSRTDFCDQSCKMPIPANCDYTTKSFGACEPSVRSICNGITTYHHECETMQDELQHVTNEYDALSPGVPPCRVDADAPFAKAAYAQMKYEAAYVDWVNAVNDATEVCTIGHALWVHNLGLYQAHYDAMENTIADLKALCNASNPEEEFDISEAVAEASKSYFKPSSGPHKGRKLVWWQQLCEPSIAALEELLKSLEIASPQLMCFAETCQMKKAAEADAFEALVAAHNKFSIAYSAYTTEVDAYNKKVEAKETALAVAIAAFESFHPVKDKISMSYTKVVTVFEKVDEAYDPETGVCPQIPGIYPLLDPCQTQTLCHELMKKNFDEYVDVDTCSAKDVEGANHAICNPPPSPPPPPPSPSPPPPQLSPEERAARARAEALRRNGASASGIPGFLDAAMKDKVKEKVVQAVSDELEESRR